MGYVFDFQDAGIYDTWFEQVKNRYCLDLEIRLMQDLLCAKQGQRLLDIGCGTGISLEPFLNNGLQLTGVDPSTYMLDMAAQKFGDKVDLHKAYAEALPFEDNSFEYSIFFTSIEFMDRPAKAIEEACRVTKDKVFIGVLNKHAPVNIYRRAKSLFSPSIYRNAKFFSIRELKRLIYSILGDVPVYWNTTLQMPFFTNRFASYMENTRIVRKSPFGTMIGMQISPVPRFRTKPLSLRVKTAKSYKPATGLARNLK